MKRLLPFFKKMAELTGLEPATSHVTGERSNQLSYNSANQIVKSSFLSNLVGAEGLEPPTSSL